MISAQKNVAGHRSVYKKQDPNKKDSLTPCTNTANLYFNNGDSSEKDRLQRTDSRRMNPGFYSLSIGPNVESPRVAKILIDNIQAFLSNNKDCKSVNIKFHSFNNDSLPRATYIEKAILDEFPGLEIRCKTNVVSNESNKIKRFSNGVVRRLDELNKRSNLLYEAEFYSAFSNGRNTGTAEKFGQEKGALEGWYRTEIGKSIAGMSFDIVHKRKEYTYQGDDCCSALEKLIVNTPFLLDCRLFVHLCIALSVKDELGNVEFNKLVSNKYGGRLSLGPDGMLKLLEDFGMKTEARAVEELTKGDILFIRSVNASAFHPASSMNSNNLICIGKSMGEDRQLLLRGFGKEPPLSLCQWKEKMSSLAHENLTYADLQLLKYLSDSDEVPVGANISFKKAWGEIVKLNGEQLLRDELSSLGETNMRSRYTISDVKTPKNFIEHELHCSGFVSTVRP